MLAMRSVLFWRGIPLVVTSLLVVTVNTENIKTRRKIFQRSAQETALVGHVIQSTQASRDIDCLMDCSREQRCLSFNYKSNRGDGISVCELNDQTLQSRPDSVVPMDGYYYYGPESSCTSDLCLNGGTCRPVIDDPHQRYQCQCLPDFTGERCEDNMADFDINLPARQSASDYVLLGKMPHQLTSFTVSLFVNLTKDVDHTFVSYATPTYHNAIFVHQRASILRLWVNNKQRQFSPNKIDADGAWHHLAMTWTNVQGQVSVYIDGIPKVTVLSVATNNVIQANGIVAIGNDQDSYGGGFVAKDALCGSISRVNIWNTVLPRDVITSLAGKCGNEAGTAVAWKDFRKGATGVSYHGEAKSIVPSACKYP
ncbi:sushi, von Willebrand factor type A, EGF and pentraxin domain-containing protein 1-like [Actinia tenebrosa]|uniref:Sushi, von Willebrand factor type A, EGF and pentraxin domain-containing protein 1-like n=1 Tax=Actinia tenebrosa TaxID=6105 RepID=A0A6P8HJR2_ACTTE|nr:sushi, von Willebrand factor type A, EGF and pentraxin domain-containing protein 1-like [Actinia tenebrosa]